MMPDDEGWKRTREVYARKVRDLLQGKQPGGGMHVHVFVRDLQYMLEELNELDKLREVLGKPPPPQGS